MLFSGVVLPGGNGIDFAETVVQQLPGIKVLLGSGYTKITARLGPVKHAQCDFLQKPYPLDELLTMLRRIFTG